MKSQRIVRFPTQDLNPMRYTSQNGNEGPESNLIRTVNTTPGSVLVEAEVQGPEGEQEKEEGKEEKEKGEEEKKEGEEKEKGEEGKGEEKEKEEEGEEKEEKAEGKEETDHGTGDQEQVEEGAPGNHITEAGQQPEISEGETDVPIAKEDEKAETSQIYNCFAITVSIAQTKSLQHSLM